jgi:hypothetical protein
MDYPKWVGFLVARRGPNAMRSIGVYAFVLVFRAVAFLG